jgi:hypothetical protein
MLPESVSQLHTLWDVLSKPDNTSVWEFLWDSKVDENRERGLLQTALTTNLDDIPLAYEDPNNSQEVQVAEAAMKVCRPQPRMDVCDADFTHVRWCLERQMRITCLQEEPLYYALWEKEQYQRRRTIFSVAVFYQRLSKTLKGPNPDEL